MRTNLGTVYPRPSKHINGRKAPVEKGEAYVTPNGELKVAAHDSTWTWQITTGRRAHGTRRTHSKGGYPTREAAEEGLIEARAKLHEQGDQRLPRVAPAVIDNSMQTICALLDDGHCTAGCVLAAIEEHLCACHCGGEFHGLARDGHAAEPDPRALLRALRGERESYQDREEAAVQAARAAGIHWAEIGELTGLNPDALSRKHGRRRPGGVHTHCPNGHEYTGTNVVEGPGGRKCRACLEARRTRQATQNRRRALRRRKAA